MATLTKRAPVLLALTSGLLISVACGGSPLSAALQSNGQETGGPGGHTGAPEHVTERVGPFGLSMGMSRDDVERATTNFKPSGETPSGFASVSVPRPHDAFESYVFIITDKHGLCRIVAIGKDVEMNAFGTQVRSEVESVQDALTPKYGAPQVYDFVQAGSIWNEPQDWAMGLLKAERTLAAFWIYKEPRAGDRISSIQLSANALSRDKAYLTLRYEFDNTEACMKEIASAQNAVL